MCFLINFKDCATIIRDNYVRPILDRFINKLKYNDEIEMSYLIKCDEKIA